MTLQQLMDFVVVVEHGSLRRAAQSTGQSQASLTKSIKRLEVSLGLEILVRNSRGITLTQGGERFLPRASLILSEVRQAKADASMASRGHPVVSFGASPLAAISLAPAAIEEFRRRNSDVVVRCANGPYAKLLAELRAGKLDFIACPVLDSSADNSLVVDAVSSHKSIIVANASHPLRKASSLRELAESKWIANGPIERPDASITAMFQRYGIGVPKIAMYCESFVDALAHVQRSELLSLCPPCLDAIGLSGKIAVIRTVEETPEQSILLMRRRDRVLSREAHTLYEIFTKGARPA